MTETPTLTGADLRVEREKAGIKLQDLAYALGMDQSSLSRTENGFRAVDADLPDRYMAEVRRIARERAEAVGAFDVNPAPAEEESVAA